MKSKHFHQLIDRVKVSTKNQDVINLCAYAVQMEGALQVLANNKMNDDNVGSIEVAARRVRTWANNGLA